MINLDILKRLLVELEENLPNNTNKVDRFVQISKCIGLLSGIIGEATMLISDFSEHQKPAVKVDKNAN